MKLTTLDALLIFLVGHKSQSGYDIRQIFQSTPLGVFSDSPGSIYPSLARLDERGLLASTAEAEGRRRRSYKRTAAGQKALTAWLERPLERDPRKRRDGEVELRFVLIAEALGLPRAVKFLDEAEAAYSTQLAEIEAFMAGPGAQMSEASRATTDLGMRLIRLHIDWCRETKKRMGRRT
jgi:DNA-binding PadR family transcriptional regulator